MKKIQYMEAIDALRTALDKCNLIALISKNVHMVLSPEDMIAHTSDTNHQHYVKLRCPSCSKIVEPIITERHNTKTVCPACGQNLILPNSYHEQELAVFGFKYQNTEIFASLTTYDRLSGVKDLSALTQLTVYDYNNNCVYGWYPYGKEFDARCNRERLSDKTPDPAYAQATSCAFFAAHKYTYGTIMYLFSADNTPFKTYGSSVTINSVEVIDRGWAFASRFQSASADLKTVKTKTTKAAPRLIQNAVDTYDLIQSGITSIGKSESRKIIEESAKTYSIYKVINFDNLRNTQNVEITCPQCGARSTIERQYNNSYFQGDGVCSCGCDLSHIQFVSSENYIHRKTVLFIEDYNENKFVLNYYYYKKSEPDHIASSSFIVTPKGYSVIKKINNPALAEYVEDNHLPYEYYSASFGAIDEMVEQSYSDFIVANLQIFNHSTKLKYLPWSQFTADLNIQQILNYILLYLQAPDVMESVVKRMPSIAEVLADQLNRQKLELTSDDFSNDWTSVESMMKVNKANMKVLQSFCARQYKHYVHRLAIFATKHDELLSEELISYCQNHGITTQHIEHLYEELPNVTLTEMMQYLEHCRQYQCIKPVYAISLWADYAMNASKIGIDFTDKKARHPRSLKMEHDVFTYKYELLQSQERNKMFEEMVQQDEKYVYKNIDLFIRPPKNMEELFEEGRKLDHCVGTYGDRIIAGKSHIFFVRWNKQPNIPYFTVEVIGKAITQIHGFGDCNRDATTPELNQFIHDWAKLYKLSIQC